MISPQKSFVLAVKAVVFMSCIFFAYVGISKAYTWYLFNKFKNNPKLYVYDNFSGKSLNPILYVSDVLDSIKLKEYYRAQMKGIEKSIPFELKYLPVDRPVFVIRYLDNDSSIIEFVDIATCCWGHVRGYIYGSTAHELPPDNERLTNYQEFLQKLPPSPRYYRKVSDYGVYCDCE
jgi:hypothetical protein